mmetsp:Transcript_5426/g.22961  ORF Transcript_5426/g.22961 Transcript_5426/m.22961 type:complete len:237 (+) Transcript_5426:533-1243(+)
MERQRRRLAPARLASLAASTPRASSARACVSSASRFSPNAPNASSASSSSSPMCSTVSATGSAFGTAVLLFSLPSLSLSSTATSASSAARSSSSWRRRCSRLRSFARASLTMTRRTSSGRRSSSSRVSAPACGRRSACSVEAPPTPPRAPNMPPRFEACDRGSENTEERSSRAPDLSPEETRDCESQPESLAEYRVVWRCEVRSEDASPSDAGPSPRALMNPMVARPTGVGRRAGD